MAETRIGAIHLDAVGGIAGDMFVAALLDALPDLASRVLADAAAVLPPGLAPRLAPMPKSGIAARHFGLEGEGTKHAADYRDLVARIRSSPLAEGTAEHAVAILTILATAEARIHGVALDDVHFHEIGDWDSLLDVVAAGSIAAALPGVGWSVSALPLGGGLVRTRHGLLPVPAPATSAILEGFVWRDDGIAGERVTPTGAAILKHLGAAASPAGGMLSATGTGAGTRDLPGMPNILRALVFAASEDIATDRVGIIGFEIDDMTGEEIAVAADRLRGLAGVLDLTIGQRQGKKGRMMHGFRLLVRPEAMATVAERCFIETATIGLRIREERRLTLVRESHDVAGMAVKRVRRPDGQTSAKAESDDLAAGDSLVARRRAKARAEGGGPA